MNHDAFAEALNAAVPTLVIQEDPSSPPPDGHVPISFEVVPVAGGVRLSIQIDDDKPYRWKFTSEREAAAFLSTLSS